MKNAMKKEWVLQDVVNIDGPMPIIFTWMNSRTNEVVFERLPGAVHLKPCRDCACPKNRIRQIVESLLGHFPESLECRDLIGFATDRAPKV